MRIFLITTALSLGLASVGLAHGNNADLIERVYFKYLGRLPDADGYSFWSRKLSYHSPLEFEATVLGSKEYFDRKCAGCQRTFIRALYRDVLNDWDPCPKSVERWMYRLQQCGCRQRLATEFLSAASAARQPVVVRPEPKVVRQEPVIIRKEPVVVRPEPVIIRSEPVIIRSEPVVIQPEPVYVQPPGYYRGYGPTRSYRERAMVPVPSQTPSSDHLHLHFRF